MTFFRLRSRLVKRVFRFRYQTDIRYIIRRPNNGVILQNWANVDQKGTQGTQYQKFIPRNKFAKDSTSTLVSLGPWLLVTRFDENKSDHILNQLQVSLDRQHGQYYYK